jgi:hypothetical protein
MKIIHQSTGDTISLRIEFVIITYNIRYVFFFARTRFARVVYIVIISIKRYRPYSVEYR